MSNRTVDYLQAFVATFTWLYIAIIIAWMLSTWVQLPYNIWINRIRTFLDETVQPYLRLWRRILPMFGPLDLSPMVGVIAVLAAEQVVLNVLDGFRP